MLPLALVLGVSIAYLLALFGVAAWADRRAAAGRSVVGSAWVHALALGVYCSAWTYFGSVGRAASGGVWFLPIYLGPTLAMVLAWRVLRKLVRVARAQRITSVADFIASRHGQSRGLAALVSLLTVVGILPYIALQLKAVAAGLQLLTAPGGAAAAAAAPWWADGTLGVALVLAGFTMVFGTRQLDASERHEGLLAAVAAESLVKLLAFLAVGAAVTWGLFDGPTDLFGRALAQPALAPLFRLDQGQPSPAAQWLALTLLAMLSVLLLPRQFQVLVVENVDERHLKRAAWVFPAYLLLINLFVLPLAVGGLLHFQGRDAGALAAADLFVLSLPLDAGWHGLALLAFLGGLSAATGMVIVEATAVATMVCNDLLVPLLLRLPALARRPALGGLLLGLRRGAILVLLLLGYAYFRLAGEAEALVSIGLISFAAVAQCAPAVLFGLYWKGGTRAGALAGLLAGFGLWAHALVAPAIVRSGWWSTGLLTDGPFGITLLRPEQLGGLTGLDPLTQALFWSLLANAGLYVVVSLLRPPSPRQAARALLFVDGDRHSGADQPLLWRGQAQLADLQALALRFLGPAGAHRLLQAQADAHGVTGVAALRADAGLVQAVEMALAGAIGSASARLAVAGVVREQPLALDDVLAMLDEASQVRRTSRALQAQTTRLEEASAALRAANVRLAELDRLKDDFMASVTHELRTPLTAIRSLAELMAQEPGMDSTQRQRFLAIVVAESERLSRLVNQVLDLAKIEAGHAEWRSADVDLPALARQAADTAQPLLAARGAMLALDLPAQLPTLRADPDRLQQVLLNLLSNAAKVVPSPGGQIRLRLWGDADGAHLTVQDNGPGVPVEQQALIFERFRQGGSADHRPAGTGLGLTISRQIVAHFGGQLRLLPSGGADLGQGACFQIDLPWTAAAAEPPPAGDTP